MAISAHNVAAELRRLLPDVGKKKIHKLLYYCQGHHLAHFGVPLFVEQIAAWDMGPVVADLWAAEKYHRPTPPPTAMNEGELNTVGYVASRYGRLTGRELELMSHAERPWRLANANRIPRTTSPIANEWIREYFVEADAADRAEGPVFDTKEVAALLDGARERLAGPDEPDDVEAMRAKYAQMVATGGR
jgi:uncharacterized phage-associated protein